MAIAYDNSGSNGASFTCSGTNRILFILQMGNVGSDTMGAPTFNGVALTKLTSFVPSGARSFGLWYMINPPTGSQTLAAGANVVNHSYASYSGVSQTGFPDASNTNIGTSSSISASVTVVASGCWTVMGASVTGGTSAWTGSTKRTNSADNGTNIFDSNGIVNTGSNSLSATGTSSFTTGAIIVSMAPAATGSSNFFQLFN